MKLRNRLVLVALGIVIFLIVTPALVLFARGFKFDWESKQIQKTGTMVVKTEPDDARIFLNNRALKNSTPATIRFLLPGDYDVRIEKDSYQSWTKRLSIKPQLVTWANSNREFITLFFENPRLIETGPVENFPLDEEVDKSVDVALWVIEEGKLKRIHPETKVKETVATDIPQAKQTKIIDADGHVFLLLDAVLYTLNDSLEKIYNPVAWVNWNKDLQLLLFANEFEVFTYNPFDKKSELFFRSTTAVNKPFLNRETGYIFFQNEGKIKAIELDGRDHRNVYTLTEALDKFSISKDGKKLHVFNQSEVKIFIIR